MKIKGSEAWISSLKLAEPYDVAYGSIHRADNVFLRIDSDNGFFGYGCAAPDQEVTGEDAKTLLAIYQTELESLLLQQDPIRINYIMTNLRKRFPLQPSLLAMVDMALYDLIAKSVNLPLYRFLGGYRSSIATSITIGILGVEATVARAKEWQEKGYKILKIKGGLNVDLDIERVAKVREACGKAMQIRFDANQGYHVEDAVKFVRETANQQVELLEQPTPKEELELLGQVQQRTSIPIMADESLLNLVDVFHIAKNKLADMVNIKLMKVGGINEAININAVAKAAGMEIMVGCMDESALGIAAGLHFALARPHINYTDLDGHLDLIDDPAKNLFELKEGILYPNDQPGLGLIGL